MSISKELDACRNIFDIIAVMYRDCEDRPGDRRFHEINNALADSVLFDEHNSFIDAFLKKFNNAMLITSMQDLSANEGQLSLSDIIDCYADFRQRLHDGGFNVHIAASAIIKALDLLFGCDHAGDFGELFADRIIKPLNFNHVSGFPAVFLKIQSFVRPELISLSETEEAVWSSLEHLSIVELHDLDPAVEVKVDGLLWTDMRKSSMTLAIVSPEVEPTSFQVVFPPTEANVTNVFWVEANEQEKYRQFVLDALEKADEFKAAIVILPELMSSAKLEEQVSIYLSKKKFNHIKLVVLGSRHIDASGKKANVCRIFDRGGNVVWEQWKREPYHVPADSLDHPDNREWIVTEPSKQVMMYTPHGALTVQICKDFLNQSMRQLLCRLGCRWFLLPAMTPHLPGQFGDAMRDCGKLAGAVCAVANSRCVALWHNEMVNDEDLRYFYVPKKKDTKHLGEEIAKNIWIRNFYAIS